MNYRIIALATAAGLLTSTFSYSQKKIFSLEQVWQKTLSHYPSLASKKYQVEQQELNKKLVQKEKLPEINLQGQQSYGSYEGVSGALFPLPGIYTTSGTKSLSSQPQSTSNLYSSAVLQWNFLQFGKIKSKLKVADAAINMSNNSLSNEQLRLQAAATQQYFNALQSAASLSIAKADVQRLQDLFELSKAQADAGLRPGADTLLIKSNYFHLRGQVNDQQALWETAMLQLAELTGEDTANFAIDTSIYNLGKIIRALPIGDSIQNHPYLRLLKSNIFYSNARLEAVKHQPYPSVGLLAGTGIRGSGITNRGIVSKDFTESWKNATGSYLVGIGVTWNLSSLYENKVKQKIAEKEIQSAKADYDEASLQLHTSYAAAVSRWKQQKQKVEDAQSALHASQDAYDLYVTRYENGLINLIELLQLQKTLQDAENNYVRATGAYWDELINQSESIGNMSLLLSQINL
ncbi:MAG: TolC family protein [Ginsengibacter sp.]